MAVAPEFPRRLVVRTLSFEKPLRIIMATTKGNNVGPSQANGESSSILSGDVLLHQPARPAYRGSDKDSDQGAWTDLVPGHPEVGAPKAILNENVIVVELAPTESDAVKQPKCDEQVPDKQDPPVGPPKKLQGTSEQVLDKQDPLEGPPKKLQGTKRGNDPINIQNSAKVTKLEDGFVKVGENTLVAAGVASDLAIYSQPVADHEYRDAIVAFGARPMIERGLVEFSPEDHAYAVRSTIYTMDRMAHMRAQVECSILVADSTPAEAHRYLNTTAYFTAARVLRDIQLEDTGDEVQAVLRNPRTLSSRLQSEFTTNTARAWEMCATYINRNLAVVDNCGIYAKLLTYSLLMSRAQIEGVDVNIAPANIADIRYINLTANDINPIALDQLFDEAPFVFHSNNMPYADNNIAVLCILGAEGRFFNNVEGMRTLPGCQIRWPKVHITAMYRHAAPGQPRLNAVVEALDATDLYQWAFRLAEMRRERTAFVRGLHLAKSMAFSRSCLIAEAVAAVPVGPACPAGVEPVPPTHSVYDDYWQINNFPVPRPQDVNWLMPFLGVSIPWERGLEVPFQQLNSTTQAARMLGCAVLYAATSVCCSAVLADFSITGTDLQPFLRGIADDTGCTAVLVDDFAVRSTLEQTQEVDIYSATSAAVSTFTGYCVPNNLRPFADWNIRPDRSCVRPGDRNVFSRLFPNTVPHIGHPLAILAWCDSWPLELGTCHTNPQEFSLVAEIQQFNTTPPRGFYTYRGAKTQWLEKAHGPTPHLVLPYASMMTNAMIQTCELVDAHNIVQYQAMPWDMTTNEADMPVAAADYPNIQLYVGMQLINPFTMLTWDWPTQELRMPCMTEAHGLDGFFIQRLRGQQIHDHPEVGIVPFSGVVRNPATKAFAPLLVNPRRTRRAQGGPGAEGVPDPVDGGGPSGF